MITLDAKAVSAVDISGQVDDILDLPNHLRDALWRVETAGLEAFDARDGMILAGLGGSAIGGALAKAALSDRASRPIGIARGYELPAWATPETLILCASYSGNTEEALACYDAAGFLGAPRIAVTSGGRLAELAHQDGVPVIPVPGGFQPRGVVGYMTVAALEVAALSGAGPRVHSEIDVASAHLEDLCAEWGPGSPEDSLAKTIARQLHGAIPLVIGAGATAAVAVRWRCELNENAKVPASAHELPEADHNDIVGWTGAAGEFGRFAAVFLDDSDLHPRVRERIALTEALIAPHIAETVIVASRGESCTERVMSLVLLGDLVSLYLAVLRGVDPTPIAVIEAFKQELGRN